MYTEEGKWIAQSSQLYPHKGNRNIKQRAPLTWEQLSQPQAASYLFSPWSSHIAISHFQRQSATPLKISVSSSEKQGWHLLSPGSIQWSDEDPWPLSASTTAAMLLSFYVWTSPLGFIWWKSSTTGTFLAFFLRQGLAYLRPVPTGLVNDPRLASQAAEQQGGPRVGSRGRSPHQKLLALSGLQTEVQLTCLLSSGAFRKSALITAMV